VSNSSETDDIKASAHYPWALLPHKNRINQREARSSADLYDRHFRWIRRRRVAERCTPWRLGQELGWYVLSPVDVTMTPLDDIEVEFDDSELGTLGEVCGRQDLWRRQRSQLATSRTDWLRMFQFRNRDDTWSNMFVPNGEGTAEWRLGWSVDTPANLFMFIFGCNVDGLEIPMGVLPPPVLSRMNESTGLSIAVRPLREVRISRGQPVARFILLPDTALRYQITGDA
jgi:hypothetical protein